MGTKHARQTSTDAPAYPPDTLQQQASITDFVPRRYGSLLLLFTLLAAPAVAIVALHLERSALGGEAAASLHLAGGGTLAAWYLSALCLLAALGSLVIYAVRRHKTDDFKGRYRAWLWVAPFWLAMSLAATTRWHLLLDDIAALLTGTAAWWDPVLWWLIPCAGMVALVLLRLMIEMRGSVMSVAALLITAACWSAGLVLHLGLATTPAIDPLVLEMSLTLAGHVTVIMALAFFARVVVLQAGGELPQKPTRAKRSKAAAAGSTASDRHAAASDQSKQPSTKESAARSSGGRRTRIDKRHDQAPAPASREQEPAGKQASSSAETQWIDGSQPIDDPYDESKQDKRRMSKAERKRLRKQRSREASAPSDR